ncbi:Arabinanase/levansucrase/invertase [Aureobasidium sp. EXF-10727]|nr:Arabinanase/levansucrase/invertase [Aureobasidium sp. EXF-10727]
MFFSNLGLLALSGASAVLGATYSNPLELKDGGDPSIVWHEGYWYFTATNYRDISVRRATTLEGLKTALPKTVWAPTAEFPSRQCNIWAPELHVVDGQWHIYFSAGGCGDGSIQQSQVLRGGQSPWDNFDFYGTINAPAWSIDGTPLTIDGQNYFVYSCFRDDTGENLQSLCIGKNTDMLTIGEEHLFASPTEAWERNGQMPVNEGPFALYSQNRTFLSYSGSFCWDPSYSLGLLEYVGGDPLQQSSWVKTGPHFSQGNGMYSTGHNSFFASPDGTETWMAYHSSPNPAGSCGDRYANAKKIDFEADGFPILGAPVAEDADQYLQPPLNIHSIKHFTGQKAEMLLKGIAQIHETGMYSDLTVTCGTDSYKVHKAIVCTQSEFFYRACKGSFKEGQTGIIEIPARNTKDCRSEIDWDPDAEDPETVKHMMRYLYHQDYLETETCPAPGERTDCEVKDGSLLQHALLYAMGDKYGIPDLKKLARQKFAEALNYDTIAGVVKAIKVVYASTLESDQGLRQTIIDFINPDIQTWVNIPEVDACIREIPELSYALLRKNI